MFVGVQVADEGGGWMVGAIDTFDYCIFEGQGCVQRNLCLNRLS